MKNLLLYNWSLMRIVRLLFAVFLFVEAYQTRQWFFIVFGLFFGFQAIFNLGCGSCQINSEVKENEKEC
jgi:uncharacterized membrane protein HdeD (DUF308 family)